MQKRNYITQLAEYPDVLTVHQVQEILGIGRIGVYKLLLERTVFGFKAGHTYHIPKTALQEFIENGRPSNDR